jgi:hypothetical protein
MAAYNNGTEPSKDVATRYEQQRGKLTTALELLAPIYTWFNEGFATPDLREARTQLEMMTQSSFR